MSSDPQPPGNSNDLSFRLARGGVRLLALWFVAAGVWQGLGNLIGSLYDFDPSYLGYYFTTQFLRPSLAIVVGIVLWLSSGILARRILG